MTTDPIPTPALTPFELFEQLKAKGYQHRPCGQHVERGYCCPQALADAWEDFRDDPAEANEVMKRYLELDRLEVFRCWYGEPEPKARTIANPGARLALWMAQHMYADGEIETTIDYILQHR